ncbi:MAG TPA: hypothetical protein VFI70_13070 [Nitrososphaeraceae archaeon]|nr:hypothetical protein [Nitrososphaeraceae archaeon]
MPCCFKGQKCGHKSDCQAGAVKLPELQKQYAKPKYEVEQIYHKRVMSKTELDNMNIPFLIITLTYLRSESFSYSV